MQTELWQSRAHKRWFLFCLVALSLYIAFALCLAHSQAFQDTWNTAVALLWTASLAVCCCFALSKGCKRLANAAPMPQQADGRAVRRAFLIALLIALFLFGCSFAAAYPGGVTYDASNQWRQAHSGEFNNWHPVAHTLLIWLLIRVCDSYAFVLLCQVVAFALAMAYITATLVKRGVPMKAALAVHTLVAASLLVRNTLMNVGKDSAMTLGVMVLMAHAVHLIFTRGEWLKRPRNAVAFGLALGYTTLMRHNAFFFTLPLCLLALCCFPQARRWAALSAAVLLALVGVVRGPLYGALDIVYPQNVTEESVGIPMTVLGNIRQREPEALTPEAAAFLSTLADDEAWEETYTLNNYNSIKFTYDRELVAQQPLAGILRMSLESAARAPRVAFEAVLAVTDLVWGLDGQGEGVATARNSGDIPAAQKSATWLNSLGEAACALLDAPLSWPPVAYVMQNIGVQLLLLLLVSLWALYRAGVSALLPALPVLLYDLGTMLLLCGQDARFFQCSAAVCLPCALALLYAPGLSARKARA